MYWAERCKKDEHKSKLVCFSSWDFSFKTKFSVLFLTNSSMSHESDENSSDFLSDRKCDFSKAFSPSLHFWRCRNTDTNTLMLNTTYNTLVLNTISIIWQFLSLVFSSSLPQTKIYFSSHINRQITGNASLV